MRTLAPLVLAALATSPASAEEMDGSAKHFLQGCRAVADRDIDQHFNIGMCAGVMIAIHDVSFLLHPDHPLRSCLPESVTIEQSSDAVRESEADLQILAKAFTSESRSYRSLLPDRSVPNSLMVVRRRSRRSLR